MDPNWQTHESGGSGDQVPRGRSKLTPMHPTTCIGSVVHGSELGAAPRHLIPRTARFMGLLVRIHESRSPMLATCKKKVVRCILDLKLSVESDYGAPRGPRASPGRVLSSQHKVGNLML